MSPKQEDVELENDAYPDHDEETSWLPRTPSTTSILNLNLGGYFDKINATREDTILSGLTLLDTVETYFDARLDLFERQLKKQKDRIQTRATLLAKERREKLKSSAEEYDKELQKFKLKVASSPDSLMIINPVSLDIHAPRTRQRGVAYCSSGPYARETYLLPRCMSDVFVPSVATPNIHFQVMNVFGTSLLFGVRPEWLHIAYTVQALYLLPLRVRFCDPMLISPLIVRNIFSLVPSIQTERLGIFSCGCARGSERRSSTSLTNIILAVLFHQHYDPCIYLGDALEPAVVHGYVRSGTW